MKKNKLNWTVSRSGPVCTDIRIDYRKASDWEQWGLITADRHIDNPKSDRALQKLHLDQAVERGAFVMDFGDLFDAMQGKQDRRSAKHDILPELLPSGDDDKIFSRGYLNRLVEYVGDFFTPYAENMALIGDGNHETSVDNKLEYNLMDGLLYRLSVAGSSVCRGGYRGWIRFMFDQGGAGGRTTKRGYYIHGYGGGGPVTRDVIQANRKAVYLSNADYVFSGHTHDQWVFPIDRTKLLDSGREILSRQYHVKIPTYKDEFFNSSGGFHHETGKPPKPIGAWWMRFYWSHRSNEIKCQFIEADT